MITCQPLAWDSFLTVSSGSFTRFFQFIEFALHGKLAARLTAVQHAACGSDTVPWGLRRGCWTRLDAKIIPPV